MGTINVGNFNQDGHTPPPPKENKKEIEAYKEQLRKDVDEFIEYAKTRREEIRKQKEK